MPLLPRTLSSKPFLCLGFTFCLVVSACGSSSEPAATSDTPTAATSTPQPIPTVLVEDTLVEDTLVENTLVEDTSSAALTPEPETDTGGGFRLEPGTGEDPETGTETERETGSTGLDIPTPTPTSLDPEPGDERPTPEPTPTRQPPLANCNAGPAENPVRQTMVDLDWDGDGETDQLVVYGQGQLDAPDWRIRVQLASGGSLDSALLVETGTRANISAIGGADVDGDNTDEAFAVVGAGAAANIVTIFAQSGCDIVPVTLDGLPINFPIGGSALNIGGLACSDDAFWAYVGTSSDGENWQIDGVQFQLQGTELTQLDAETFAADTNEPTFNYPFLTCGAISWI